MDEIHGIIISYEMRSERENTSRREAAFNSAKKTRGRKQYSSKSSFNEFDIEAPKFIIKENSEILWKIQR